MSIGVGDMGETYILTLDQGTAGPRAISIITDSKFRNLYVRIS